MNAEGTLYIVSAPSGGGKTSLVQSLLKEETNVSVSISHTTRAMRPGEKDGVDYFFVSDQEFQELNQKGIFLETARVYGHSYGTSFLWVKETLDKGIDVILEIDWQGARQVRRQFIEAIGIFIIPPSNELLKSRLEKRHQDNKDVIERRMLDAKSEISHYTEYDYLICNDQFSDALFDLKSIVRSHRLQINRQKRRLSEMLNKLIS